MSTACGQPDRVLLIDAGIAVAVPPTTASAQTRIVR